MDIKRINPSIKLLGVMLPAVLLAFFYRPILNLIVFLVCLIWLFIAKVKLRKMLPLLLPTLAIAVTMFWTGYYFTNQTVYGLKEQIFTDAAILNGLQLSSRVLAFSGLGMLFLYTTDKTALIQSLMQQCKLPPKFAYGILAAWNIIPNMRYEYQKTKAAFYARGTYPVAFSPRLLVPLLVKSVRWSEALAIAMESKGFGEQKERGFYEILQVTARDGAFLTVSSIAIIVCLVLGV